MGKKKEKISKMLSSNDLPQGNEYDYIGHVTFNNGDDNHVYVNSTTAPPGEPVTSTAAGKVTRRQTALVYALCGVVMLLAAALVAGLTLAVSSRH